MDSAASALKIITDHGLISEDFSFLFFDRRSIDYGDISHEEFNREIHSATQIASLFKKDIMVQKLPMEWYAFAKKQGINNFPHGRNTFFLSAATSYAAIMHMLKPSTIVVGFLNSEGEDQTSKFVERFNALLESSYPQHFENNTPITIIAPFIDKSKTDIIKFLISSGDIGQTILKLSWSCYYGGNDTDGLHCGRCTGCRKRKNAFFDSGISDFTEYAYD
jgi:7-cyano-7-deazaguanine synthase in queuosine biosynthesis